MILKRVEKLKEQKTGLENDFKRNRLTLRKAPGIHSG